MRPACAIFAPRLGTRHDEAHRGLISTVYLLTIRRTFIGPRASRGSFERRLHVRQRPIQELRDMRAFLGVPWTALDVRHSC